MRKAFVFTLYLGTLLLSSLACGGSVRSSQPEDGGIEETQPQSAPQPTVTAIPTPPPSEFMPQAPPEEGDLAAIVRYANSMQPLLADAGAILERDGGDRSCPETMGDPTRRDRGDVRGRRS
ncbi:MAG: hypothetical protein V3V46_01790 [Anaerolineales bacterium]